jgi:hypothetical protein
MRFRAQEVARIMMKMYPFKICGPYEGLLTGYRDARQQDARETELEGSTHADSLKNFGQESR